MAFGQSSGPPATGKQINELLELLAAAGHSDFRDARGPMGFTQRQAGGKFSRDEADAFIEQLQNEIYGEGPPSDSSPPAAARTTAAPPSKIARRQPETAKKQTGTKAKPRTKPSTKTSTRTRTSTKTKDSTASEDPERARSIAKALAKVSTELLVAEVERRGLVVLDPDPDPDPDPGSETDSGGS